jgi:tetratricopeptide (TPR) repeat protein
MKIFFSYGHDTNIGLVLRIRGDVEQAGHSVWIDESEIKAGDVWRRKILDGLKDTNWMLAFLSRHSVRDPGVCLDEIAITMGAKGDAFSTILVEPEQEVRVPVSISHIQWSDMSDWRTRQSQDGPEWEAWYRERVSAILASLADPATHRFSGEIAELEKLLRPISQAADIPPLIDGFVGREWLRGIVETWRKDHTERRMFWLTGGAGSGKSAFSAWLTHFARTNVIGLNLCRWNDQDRRDPQKVLRTLAFLIGTRLPDYRRAILDKLRIHDPAATELLAKGPVPLFNWLLAEPLHYLIDGGRRNDRYIIIIDALDETLDGDHSELADLLAEGAKRLPDWIALLLTSRPEPVLQRILSGLDPTQIDAKSNDGDLRDYAKRWLATPERPATEVDGLVKRVVTAAGGNFLYLAKLREAVEQGWLTLDRPGRLPRGLVGLYRVWFRRQFPKGGPYRKDWAPLLEVLVAAQQPVPLDVLQVIFCWSGPVEEAERLEGLGSLFTRTAEGVAPFHASLRDWLTDASAAGATFVLDIQAGRAKLSDMLWARFLALPEAAEPDRFLLAVLPVVLAAETETSLTQRLQATDGPAVIFDRVKAIVRQLRKKHAWDAAAAWLDLLNRLGLAAGDAGIAVRAATAGVRGDIAVTQGRYKLALSFYRESLAIFQRLAASDPNNAQWRHDVAVRHDNIGDVLRAQGKPADALAAYQCGMVLFEGLDIKQSRPEWQRDIAICHDRIGDMRGALDDLGGALTAYQAGMEIRRKPAGANRGDPNWQRDLSVSHNKIGDVLFKQGDYARSLSAFRAGMSIRSLLVEAEPDNLDRQRDLSVSHDKVGDVLKVQGDLPGALAHFQTGMKISDRLDKADPDNSQWQRDLSVSHDKIGDVLKAQRDFSGALTHFRAGMEISKRLVALDPSNALWQRDLSEAHRKIGQGLTAKGDLREALTAFTEALAVLDTMVERGMHLSPEAAALRKELRRVLTSDLPSGTSSTKAIRHPGP